MFTMSPLMPQNSFVETTYSWRFQPSSEMARPMMDSDSPPAYTSALSKKLTPPSLAAASWSLARPTSTWLPKVTQEPKLNCETWRPEDPRRL